jgi:hypothetical protein
MLAIATFPHINLIMITVQEGCTRITSLFLTLMTVVVLVVQNHTQNVALLEFLYNEVSHIAFGLYLS